MRNYFLLSRLWFLASLLIFMLSVAILPKTTEIESIWEVRVVIFFGRTFMYLVTMTRLLIRSQAAQSRDITGLSYIVTRRTRCAWAAVCSERPSLCQS